MGTWIVACVGKTCEILSVDSSRKLCDTLEPSLWIHNHGSGVTLLLRVGTIVSMVGWNVLGLQPVGDSFH